MQVQMQMSACFALIATECSGSRRSRSACAKSMRWHTKHKKQKQEVRITIEGLLKQTKRTATSKNMAMKTVLVMLVINVLLLGSGMAQAQRIGGLVSE
jgi:hypothetical protein